MMIDIPDAPWIRDAELYGEEEAPDVYCPMCGEENPEHFYVQDGEIIGCDNCVEKVEPYDWYERNGGEIE